MAKSGLEILRDPLLNKGSGFTKEERELLGLDGLLPSGVNSLEQQAERFYRRLNAISEPLQKYGELAQLQDRNEVLFYKVLENHISGLMPIVYTPTVGLATQRFSQVFRRGRGIWITPEHRGRVKAVLKQGTQHLDLRLIVATDNEAILGLGDQGVGGMAISIGKLAIYTIAAGIHPRHTLPISLDVGTDNEALLSDELYLGWSQPRLRGEAYLSLLDEFVDAVCELFPNALLQWEDFARENAFVVLERYKRILPSFNDDIQGTGAVALSGIQSAMRLNKLEASDQRVIVVGAGAAGVGIARQIVSGLKTLGQDPIDAHASVLVVGRYGLVRKDLLSEDDYKWSVSTSAPLVRQLNLGDKRALMDVVKAFKPTVLIGACGQAGIFTESLVKEMAKHTARPVIMPFSNPTKNCEAVPADLMQWTDGTAIVATGSPFEPVRYKGKVMHIAQGNNAFIFPGLGMGAILARASTVTDGMIDTSAGALSRELLSSELEDGYLFPDISRIRKITRSIALAVIERAVQDGVACSSVPTKRSDIEILVDKNMWAPNYSSV